MTRRVCLPVLVGLLLLCGLAAGQDGTQVFTGRLFDGRGGDPVEDGVLVVRDGRVVEVGKKGEVEMPDGVEPMDFGARTIIPGLINAHGHVGATRGLVQGAEHYTEENILRQLGLYARYGITTVFSLGGDGEAGVRVRAAQDGEAGVRLDRARLYLAGPVVSATTPEAARQQVREVAGLGADLVKIRVDDFLGRVPKMSPEIYAAVMDEAHKLDLSVAVHLFYLEDAKGVLKSGGDFIAHSVRDREVDSELLTLLRDKEVCLCPTLTREVSTYVYESTPKFFSDPFFLREADPQVLTALRDPQRQARTREDPGTPIYKEALRTAQKNLKLLSDAGVPIAFGTDSGPPARFQGYFEHMEMDLMAEAGLTPRQILLSATRDAARCLGHGEEIGTLEPGRWADFVVLEKDPLADIRNARSLHSVWIAGNRVPSGEGQRVGAP